MARALLTKEWGIRPHHTLKEVIMHMVNDVTVCSPADVKHIIELVAQSLSQPQVFIEHMHEERTLCDLIDILAEHHATTQVAVVDILEANEVY